MGMSEAHSGRTEQVLNAVSVAACFAVKVGERGEVQLGRRDVSR